MCCSRPDCTPRGPPNQLAAAKATSLKHMQGVARHPAIECRKQAACMGLLPTMCAAASSVLPAITAVRLIPRYYLAH